MVGFVVLATACGDPGSSDPHDGSLFDARGAIDAVTIADASHVDVQPIIDAQPCLDLVNPQFTAPFTALDDLEKIVPLGGVSGWEIKPHTYPGFKDPLAMVPVYAPVDARLTSIAWVDQAEFTGYTLGFDVSCTVRFRFAHIEQPIDEIRALGPAVPGSSAGEPPSAPYSVTAGQLIGHATLGMDFGVYDENHANPFADLARYDNVWGQSYLRARCPYDLYDEPTRSTYYGLFGGFTSGAGSCGDCRNASMDVPGTIAGAWYVEPNTTGTSGPRLAAAADCDGTVRIGGPDFDMMITDGPDPKTVTTAYCYSTAENWIYLRLVSDSLLDEAHGSGACPGSFPTTGVTRFQR